MFRLLSVALLLTGANAFAPSLPAMKTVAVSPICLVCYAWFLWWL